MDAAKKAAEGLATPSQGAPGAPVVPGTAVSQAAATETPKSSPEVMTPWHRYYYSCPELQQEGEGTDKFIQLRCCRSSSERWRQTRACPLLAVNQAVLVF